MAPGGNLYLSKQTELLELEQEESFPIAPFGRMPSLVNGIIIGSHYSCNK